MGVAVAGAIADRPGSPGFLGGFHAVAAGTACLYLLSATVAVALVPGTR